MRQHAQHAHANTPLHNSVKASESTSLLDQILSYLNSKDLDKAKTALIKFNGKDTKTFEAAILRGEVQCYSLKELEGLKKSKSIKDKIRQSIFTGYVNTGIMRSVAALCIGRAIRSFFHKNFKIREKKKVADTTKALDRIRKKDYKSVGIPGVYSPMSLAYTYCVQNVDIPGEISGFEKFQRDINAKNYFYTAKNITNAETHALFQKLQTLAEQRVFYRPTRYVYGEHSSKLTKSESKTVPLLRAHATKFISSIFFKHFDASPLGERDDSDTLRAQIKDYESIITDNILLAIFPEPDMAVQEQNRISEIFLKTSQQLDKKVNKIIEGLPNANDVSSATVDKKMAAIFEYVFGTTHRTLVESIVQKIRKFEFSPKELRVNDKLIQPLRLLHDELMYHLRQEPSMTEAIRLSDEFDATVGRNPRAAATVLCVYKINRIFAVSTAFFKQYTCLWPSVVPNGNLSKPSCPWTTTTVKNTLKKLRKSTSFPRDADYSAIVVAHCGLMHSFLNELSEFQSALKASDDIYRNDNSIFIPFVSATKKTKKKAKKTSSSSESKDSSATSYCYKYWLGKCQKDPCTRTHADLNTLSKDQIAKMATSLKLPRHKHFREHIIGARKDIDLSAILMLSSSSGGDKAIKRKNKNNLKPCYAYAEGKCERDPCQFSHDDAIIEEYKKLKKARRTELCRPYVSTGSCRFGGTCQFLHPKDRPRVNFAATDVRYQPLTAMNVTNEVNAVLHQQPTTSARTATTATAAAATSTSSSDTVIINGFQYKRV